MAAGYLSSSARRRSSRIWGALLGGALAAGGVAWAEPAQAQTKIAAVELRRAVAETEDGLRVTAALRRLFDKRQAELSVREADLQKEKEELDKAAQAKSIPQADLQKRYARLQQAAAELQGLAYEYQREMAIKENEL